MEFIFDNFYEASGLWLHFVKTIRDYGYVSKADLHKYDPSLFSTGEEQVNYTWNFYGWNSYDDISVDRKDVWTFVYYGAMSIQTEKKRYVVTLTRPKKMEL